MGLLPDRPATPPRPFAWPGPHRSQFAAGTTGSRRAADAGLITPAHRLFPPACRNIRATLGRLIPNFSAISFHFLLASRSFITRAWSLRRAAPPFTPADTPARFVWPPSWFPDGAYPSATCARPIRRTFRSGCLFERSMNRSYPQVHADGDLGIDMPSA